MRSLRPTGTGCRVALLVLAAPFFAEVLPGVNPPAELVQQPWSLIPLVWLYGSAALLARELTLRWGGGYGTLLLLGAAHGVVEEGLLVRSFFDPSWMQWPALSDYGRWMGINVIWALHLTLYHAVVSIAVPVTLVQGGQAWSVARPWLGRRGWRWVVGLYFLRVALGWVGETPYRAPWPYTVGALALAVFLVFLAWWAARRPSVPSGERPARRAPSPGWMFLGALLVTAFFFVLSWGLPLMGIPAAWVGLGMGLLAVGVGVGGWAWSRREGWGERHRFALAAGCVAFFVLLAGIQEWRPDPAASRQGMGITALLVGWLLAWVYFRLPRRRLDEDGFPRP